MGMVFYALDDRVQMFVDNPGYGEIIVRGFADDGDTLSRTGAQLGQLVEMTTQRAFGVEPEARPVLPAAITAVQAAELLPSVQRAVLLAAAGTDRYGRTDGEAGQAPADVLCVDCAQGSDFHHAVTISERRSEYGHTPFGYLTGTTWEQAQTLAAAARRRWESSRPRS